MNKIRIFLMLSGYQLTWLMCVFGEIIYNSFLPGLCCGLIFLILCFSRAYDKKKFILTVISISLIGYIFDSLLIFFQIYSFETSLNFGFLPIWMLVLWPSFASLFDEVFKFLSKFKLPAVFLSCILGPLTYFSGEPLGLIDINTLSLLNMLLMMRVQFVIY